MNKASIFNFKTDISGIRIPRTLNNPFGSEVSEISEIAANEFQEFIRVESCIWEHDFSIHKGKMFGILVVQLKNGTYAYLATISGKLSGNITCQKFIPSVFDEATDDFFINKGMTALTEIGRRIKMSNNASEIEKLNKKRKLKSLVLQEWLFKNYQFLNLSGIEKNVLEIFKDSSHGNPPAAAGECAAPKLLQYAFKQALKPIALVEFWWGKSPKNLERKQGHFYPACKNKCRPILEFMLDNTGLYNLENSGV